MGRGDKDRRKIGVGEGLGEGPLVVLRRLKTFDHRSETQQNRSHNRDEVSGDARN